MLLHCIQLARVFYDYPFKKAFSSFIYLLSFHPHFIFIILQPFVFSLSIAKLLLAFFFVLHLLHISVPHTQTNTLSQNSGVIGVTEADRCVIVIDRSWVENLQIDRIYNGYKKSTHPCENVRFLWWGEKKKKER